MIKVLICDDSPVFCRYMFEIFKTDPQLFVVGVAGNGQEAIQLNQKFHPDIIVMDIQMPVMNGIEATRTIMSDMPVPIVILSGLLQEEVNLGMLALEAGALTVVPKATGLSYPGAENAARILINTVKLMSEVKVVRRNLLNRINTNQLNLNVPKPGNRPPGLIAIAGSTGGPPALQKILKALPLNFKIPILITQHILPGFLEKLVVWLRQTTGRDIACVRNGAFLEFNSGKIWFAPDNAHLVLNTGFKLTLDESTGLNAHKPSADVMFESVARTAGSDALGIILTGMGSDGARGLKKLHDAGAVTLAQDESTSVVFGMPKAAIDLKAATLILSLDQISSYLKRL